MMASLCLWLLVRKVDVIENVVRAEAVVPCALAAIAELQLRICHVRAAAHGAFMAEALRLLLILLLTLLGAHGVMEVRGLLALVAFESSKPCTSASSAVVSASTKAAYSSRSIAQLT